MSSSSLNKDEKVMKRGFSSFVPLGKAKEILADTCVQLTLQRALYLQHIWLLRQQHRVTITWNKRQDPLSNTIDLAMERLCVPFFQLAVVCTVKEREPYTFGIGLYTCFHRWPVRSCAYDHSTHTF